MSFYPQKQPARKCKTCGVACGPGASHCAEHLLQLAQYLDGAPSEADRADVYVPRLNGVRGLGMSTPMARRGMRRPRTGEELNFDGE
jgi:hypothetical protein